MSRTITINCDMGESFGLYKMGDAAAIMPHVTLANVACGFHASDPRVMRRTVGLAKERGVRVGAHPSLPDLQGFAREHAAVDPDAAAARILRAIHDGKVRSVTGNDVPVVVESVCVRSDTPGAVAVAREVHRAIEAYLS